MLHTRVSDISSHEHKVGGQYLGVARQLVLHQSSVTAAAMAWHGRGGVGGAGVGDSVTSEQEDQT